MFAYQYFATQMDEFTKQSCQAAYHTQLLRKSYLKILINEKVLSAFSQYIHEN